MLLALLAVYFFGGGGVGGSILTPAAVKQIGKQVEAVVTDAARVERASETLAELTTEIRGFEKSFAKSGKQLSGLYKDHGADADQMLAVLDSLNADWEAVQRRAIELRFDLKDALSPEEWAAVFDRE